MQLKMSGVLGRNSTCIPDFAPTMVRQFPNIYPENEGPGHVIASPAEIMPFEINAETDELTNLVLGTFLLKFIKHIPQVIGQVVHSYRPEHSHCPIYAFLIIGTWFMVLEFGPLSSEAEVAKLKSVKKNIQLEALVDMNDEGLLPMVANYIAAAPASMFTNNRESFNPVFIHFLVKATTRHPDLRVIVHPWFKRIADEVDQTTISSERSSAVRSAAHSALKISTMTLTTACPDVCYYWYRSWRTSSTIGRRH